MHLNRKYNNYSPFEITLLAVFALLFFPFIYLSFFAVPNLEDYAESIIKSPLWHLNYLYLTYDGRFFSSFLFAFLNPLKHEWYFGYKLLALVSFILLFLSSFTFLRVYLRNSYKHTLILTCTLYTTFLILNTNIAYTYYYLVSTFVYTIPLACFLCFLVCIRKLILSNSYWRSLCWFFLTCILLICSCGGVEQLLIPICLSIIALFTLYSNKRFEIILIGALTTFLIFIVFSSPGLSEYLYVESSEQRGLSFTIKALTLNFGIIGNKLLFWTKKLPLLIPLFFVTVLAIKPSQKQQTLGSLSHFVYYILAGAGLLYLIVLPYTWAAGNKASPDYLQALIIPSFILSMLIIILLKYSLKNKLYQFQYIKPIRYLLLFLLVLLLFLCDNNIKVAYQDIVSGKAKNYHVEVMRNIENSSNNTEGFSDICLLNNSPTTIFSGVYFDLFKEDFHVQYKKFYGIDKLNITHCE